MHIFTHILSICTLCTSELEIKFWDIEMHEKGGLNRKKAAIGRCGMTGMTSGSE